MTGTMLTENPESQAIREGSPESTSRLQWEGSQYYLANQKVKVVHEKRDLPATISSTLKSEAQYAKAVKSTIWE